MPFVYVLTNAAMPGLVKIGMTDDNTTNARIGQLYTTGVPLPFDLQYACRVPNAAAVEAALHVAFGPQRINPRREFFRIESEQAIAILRLLNQASDVTDEVAAQPSEVDTISLAAAESARARRPNLNFVEMGIPIGSTLFADANGAVTVTVVSERRVRCGDEELSLTAATAQLLAKTSVRPTILWRYEGRLLSEIYEDTYAFGE